MFLNDLMDDRQAQSRSFVFSRLGLRREKRVENMFEVVFLDPLTGIFNVDLDPDFSCWLHELAGLDA